VVLRRDRGGVLAIGQPAHAWLCGQMARAWGNERFGAVAPLEEVALAAEQHDVGMAALDLNPPLDPGTGLPQSFMDLPIEVHLSLWRAGPPGLVSQSRYAALLAAMHGRRLYERRDLDRAPRGEAAAIRAFLEHSRAFEASMLESLRGDGAPEAARVTPELVTRNSQLIWIWDTLSLALLLDWLPRTLAAVPAADGGALDLGLERLGAAEQLDDTPAFSLCPWPFTEPSVRLRCEGRRLTERFASQEELTAAFAQASWETLELRLLPGPAPG
jgi:hypothetical protein